jgi:hypothetical protein
MELLGLIFIITLISLVALFVVRKHGNIVDVEPNFEVAGEQYNEVIDSDLTKEASYMAAIQDAKFRSNL